MRSSFSTTGPPGERDLFLRRIEVWDEAQQRALVFLTNHRRFAATTVAAIYRERWQIELFFRALKQNLRIKTFVGTSANALRIQVWTALIAMLLLKYLQLRPASVGACPISPPCCASNCSSIAICSPGSINPFNPRPNSLPSPNKSRFPGNPTWTA